MNCPKCNQEMQAGFLQTGSQSTISWVSELLPSGIGYWKKDAEVVSEPLGAGVPAVPAHICKTCKLLLGDYSRKK